MDKQEPIFTPAGEEEPQSSGLDALAQLAPMFMNQAKQVEEKKDSIGYQLWCVTADMIELAMRAFVVLAVAKLMGAF